MVHAVLVPVALLGFVVTFFVGYRFLYLVGSLVFPGRQPSQAELDAGERRSFCIIIPAHNEERMIEGLVTSIRDADYPADRVRICVIADNCSDETAIRARQAGAEAFERFDDKLRGKPYALNWLIAQLDLDASDALVIIDADTVIDRQYLSVMNYHLGQGRDVIQGYFGVMNPDDNWLTRLAILPGLLKFRLHHPAKNRLGLSAPLAGNGMCFRNTIFKEYGWNAFTLTENWEYYAMLVSRGHKVWSGERAVIYSQVAQSLKQGTSQRLRWLKGRLQTLGMYGGRLLRRGLFKADMNALDALVEIMLPSLSMIFVWSWLFLGAAAVLALQVPGRLWVVVWAAVAVTVQMLSFILGLIIQRAPLRTWLSLFMVPPYLIWKTAVSIYGLLSLHKVEWIKTDRND